MLKMATDSANDCQFSFALLDVVRREKFTEACDGSGSANVKRNLRFNIHQCNHVNLEMEKLFQGRQHVGNPAAEQFSGRIQRKGFDLVEEFRTENWLLKAVEIGDCPEDFVEFHLDLYWSSRVLDMACQKIGCDTFLDDLRGLWRLDMDRMVLDERQENSITKVHEFRENDKQSLISKVYAILEHHGGCLVDHQLATILNDRNRCCITSTPRDLEKHVKHWSFNIYVHWFKLGHGGSSFVVRYPWVHKKKFVLKLPLKSSGASDAIKKEAKIMEKCRHPYIVGMVGCWEINSKSLMMMESMKCTLTELMTRSRTFPFLKRGVGEGFPPSKAIALMLPVAKALRSLHGKEKPIAHRDIKPDNIMCSVNSEDATKLIDFGDAVEFHPTRTYGVAGSYGYMAPEVRKRESSFLDLLKADVYSFGMVFGELLTWKTPEEALCDRAGKFLRRSTVNDLLECGWRPLVPSNIPTYLAFIIESCWRKSPLSRPGFVDICLMLQNAQLLLDREILNVSTEEALTMVSYTDSDGVDWPIIGKSTLREMLNMEEEIYVDDILDILPTIPSAEGSRKRQKLDDVGTSGSR